MRETNNCQLVVESRVKGGEDQVFDGWTVVGLDQTISQVIVRDETDKNAVVYWAKDALGVASLDRCRCHAASLALWSDPGRVCHLVLPGEPGFTLQRCLLVSFTNAHAIGSSELLELKDVHVVFLALLVDGASIFPRPQPVAPPPRVSDPIAEMVEEEDQRVRDAIGSLKASAGATTCDTGRMARLPPVATPPKITQTGG